MARGGCGCLVVAVAATIAGLGLGSRGAYTALTHPEPVELTCAEYEQQRPSAVWLTLRECRADVLEALYRLGPGEGEIRTLWIPLRAVGSDPATPASLVLETNNPDTLAWLDTVTAGLDGSTSSDADAVIGAIDALDEELVLTVQGGARLGWDLESKEHAEIAALSDTLDERFVILQEGQAPSLRRSAGWLALGVLGVFSTVLVGLGMVYAEET